MLIPGTVAAALAGLLFGLSLIVAIGAQNTYVIRQGIARAHVPTVVVICAASDVILIAAGVAGLAARRALRPGRLTDDGAAATSSWPAIVATSSWPAIVATCLAFTWLN